MSLLRRGKALQRKTRINPVSERKRKEREQAKAAAPLAHAWWVAVAKGKRCSNCGSPDKVQGHHVVSQQVLKRTARQLRIAPEVLLWDVRVGIAACERCHSGHTSRARPLPESVLPEAAWEFAREYGLVRYLERDYPELDQSRARAYVPS